MGHGGAQCPAPRGHPVAGRGPGLQRQHPPPSVPPGAGATHGPGTSMLRGWSQDKLWKCASSCLEEGEKGWASSWGARSPACTQRCPQSHRCPYGTHFLIPAASPAAACDTFCSSCSWRPFHCSSSCCRNGPSSRRSSCGRERTRMGRHGPRGARPAGDPRRDAALGCQAPKVCTVGTCQPSPWSPSPP